MLQNRNVFVKNCCNFATEIRKDSDWDKKSERRDLRVKLVKTVQIT